MGPSNSVRRALCLRSTIPHALLNFFRSNDALNRCNSHKNLHRQRCTQIDDGASSWFSKTREVVRLVRAGGGTTGSANRRHNVLAPSLLRRRVRLLWVMNKADHLSVQNENSSASRGDQPEQNNETEN